MLYEFVGHYQLCTYEIKKHDLCILVAFFFKNVLKLTKSSVKVLLCPLEKKVKHQHNTSIYYQMLNTLCSEQNHVIFK